METNFFGWNLEYTYSKYTVAIAPLFCYAAEILKSCVIDPHSSFFLN